MLTSFRYGAGGYILARPQLHALLLRQVPHERVHMGKKVLSIESGDHEVMVRFNDGTEAEGDILVRADGAYSAVLQNLYEKLKRNYKLPPSDVFPFPIVPFCLLLRLTHSHLKSSQTLRFMTVSFESTSTRALCMR